MQQISNAPVGQSSQLPLSDNTVELVWGSGELVIRNPRPELLGVLYYMHRSFVKQEGKPKEIKEERIQLYREVQPGVVTTFQGFIDLAIRTCEENSIPYRVADQRVKMPVPQIMNATGFRFGQRKMFFEMLSKNRSGIFKAPTRYGKTTIIVNVCRAFPGVQTVITAPGTDLISQLHGNLIKQLPGREVRGIYLGSRGKKCSEDITIVSMDSLHKVEAEHTKLMLIDEPHSAVSPSRIVEMMKFRNARIYGFGATIDGRFDGGDDLITGIIGPALTTKTFREAVQEGAICPIHVHMVRVKYTPFKAMTRDQAYRKMIFNNPVFNELVRRVSNSIIPVDWQSMIFIDEVKQADLLEALVSDGVVAVAQRMDPNERRQKYDDMVANVIKRCICTDIYATGITFPELRVIINAAGGGGSITATQKPGRLAEIRPGKSCGHLVDFLFVPTEEPNYGRYNQWKALSNDSYARMNHYKKTGFDVKVVNNVDDIILM